MHIETDEKKLLEISNCIRRQIIEMTTRAGSGHLTSSLSAVDLMTVLFFKSFFRFDIKNPDFPNNDRLIFSKGHASPLFYALWATAGAITQEELMTFRKFGSRLQGHPTVLFPYADIATGSLGQGLSAGVGLAMNARYLDELSYNTFVLLGDSEVTEGSVWEAAAMASHYKLDNLIAILDCNRLGQRGATIAGHNTDLYKRKFESFGWYAINIDGHSFSEITQAFKQAIDIRKKPTIIIAKTIKGKGISFLEDQNGWHGKVLEGDNIKKALAEIDKINYSLKANILSPDLKIPPVRYSSSINHPNYRKGECIATRKAVGEALVRIFPQYPQIVVLDAEVSNSTYTEKFKKQYPNHFFEMYIAEQNMVGTALGFSRRGKIPFVSTFAAFLTRAFDQIRMSNYSNANIKFIGSHAGVSVGEDGSSQMGLEDIAMFRSLLCGVVLYPSDAVSTDKLIEEAVKFSGIVYVRTTRQDTPVIYDNYTEFHIGGSHVLRQSGKDIVTIIAAGITLHEALVAYEILRHEGILTRVIDLYSIKPLDVVRLKEAASQTKSILVVEDHYAPGGIGEAVSSVLAADTVPVYSMSVFKTPQSGTPQELLDYEFISNKAIVEKVKKII